MFFSLSPRQKSFFVWYLEHGPVIPHDTLKEMEKLYNIAKQSSDNQLIDMWRELEAKTLDIRGFDYLLDDRRHGSDVLYRM